MKKIKRSTFIPVLLLIYLAAMAVWGFDNFAKGITSPLQYIGTIVVTIGIIILLHYTLKRQERRRESGK